RPGELAPASAGPRAAALYARIAREWAALHGPYRIAVRLAGGLRIGQATAAVVRVLSATGRPVPGVTLTIAGDRVSSGRVRTAAARAATISFRPLTTSPRLTVRAVGLPSTLPRVFVPTTAAAAPNGQRLVAAGRQTVSAALRSAAAKRQLGVTSTVTSPTLAAGDPVTDRVTITGAE